MGTNQIAVLVVEPDTAPAMREIDNNPQTIERIVGGDMREICPFPDAAAIIFNGRGDELELPRNYLLKNGSGQPCMLLRGTFLVLGIERGRYVSLTQEQMHRYQSVFSRDRVSSAQRETQPATLFKGLPPLAVRCERRVCMISPMIL